MESPIPTAVNIIKDEKGGRVRAAPTATPRKGAMQGVATTVAKTPEKKLPDKPDLCDKPEPIPVTDIPISNTTKKK